MPVTNPPSPPSPPLAMMGGSDNGASGGGSISSISGISSISSISSSNAASTKLASLQNLLTIHEPCRFTIAALSVFLVLQFAIGFRLFRSWQMRSDRRQLQWNSRDNDKDGKTDLGSTATCRTSSSNNNSNNYPLDEKKQYADARSIMDEEAAALSAPSILSAAPVPTTEMTGVSAAATETQYAHTVDIVAVRSASMPPLPTEADMYYGSYHVDGAGRPFPRHLPPPPPLTPPALADSVFSLENTAAAPNKLEASPDFVLGASTSPGASSEIPFIHQPNPDYAAELDMPTRQDIAASSTPTSPVSPVSPVSPRRRNYTRFVNVGAPAWLPAPTVEPAQTQAATGAQDAAVDGAVASPSYMPQSGFGREPATREIGLRGEIISALDDAGAGWKRHTRVYGGGVCLACLAAETKNAGMSMPAVSSPVVSPGDAAVAAAVAAATQAPAQVPPAAAADR